MKKKNMQSMVRLMLTPVLMVILGIVLVVRPDSASALVGKVLGWVLLVVGIGLLVESIAVKELTTSRILFVVVAAALGLWLVRTSGGRMLYTAAAVICLVLLAALTLYLDKNQGVLKLAGKEVRLLPQKAKYTAIYLTCVGGILAVAAAQFLGAMAAYYLVYAVVAWLFALLVYYTVKMM